MTICIEDAAEYMIKNNVPYGQNVTFPDALDTSRCRLFFGMRCPYNMHVIDSHTAHRDKYDPRYNWKAHLDEEVGIPHQLITLGVPEGVSTAIGFLAKRASRALAGCIIGLPVSVLIELLS